MQSALNTTPTRKHEDLSFTTGLPARCAPCCIGESECYLTVSDLTDLRSIRELMEREGWKITRAFLLGASLPDSVVDGIPVIPIHHSTMLSRMNGAILHAVRDGAVTPVIHNGRVIGSLIEFDDRHELHVMNMTTSEEGDVFAQTESIYIQVDYILEKHGFTANDIIRHWNYLKNIGDSYQGFNLSRDAYFARHGITRYPAATGIESNLAGRQQVSISLEAIRPIDGFIEVRALQSGLQCEASEYGPKFSRGMVIDDQKRRLKKVHVSGTSHIGRDGRTLVSSDPRSDVSRTMEAIEHLLHKEDATFDDIAWSIVYCKDRSAYQSFLSLYDSKGWRFPYLPAFVNICRSELRFEMECFAATNY